MSNRPFVDNLYRAMVGTFNKFYLFLPCDFYVWYAFLRSLLIIHLIETHFYCKLLCFVCPPPLTKLTTKSEPIQCMLLISIKVRIFRLVSEKQYCCRAACAHFHPLNSHLYLSVLQTKQTIHFVVALNCIAFYLLPFNIILCDFFYCFVFNINDFGFKMKWIAKKAIITTTTKKTILTKQWVKMML